MRYRPRRLRTSSSLRELVREYTLSPADLIMPYFIVEGEGKRIPIASMPGINRLSIDLIVEECKDLEALGVKGVALFPVVENKLKNKQCTEAYKSDALYARAISLLKQAVPNIVLIGDVALDPYNSDAHDGIVDEKGNILNDASLAILAKMALCQARAGIDLIAPSDMMDGRVVYLRKVLDENGFAKVGIVSYTAKYASSFYGPFRDALDSTPSFGDKKTYQMDYGNSKEALREANLDTNEGADILLVKPGLAYLDIVQQIAKRSLLPVAVYNVSGEYAMLKFAAQNGAIDYKSSVWEVLLSCKRAGASFIFTYHAKELATWMKKA